MFPLRFRFACFFFSNFKYVKCGCFRVHYETSGNWQNGSLRFIHFRCTNECATFRLHCKSVCLPCTWKSICINLPNDHCSWLSSWAHFNFAIQFIFLCKWDCIGRWNLWPCYGWNKGIQIPSATNTPTKCEKQWIARDMWADFQLEEKCYVKGNKHNDDVEWIARSSTVNWKKRNNFASLVFLLMFCSTHRDRAVAMFHTHKSRHARTYFFGIRVQDYLNFVTFRAFFLLILKLRSIFAVDFFETVHFS